MSRRGFVQIRCGIEDHLIAGGIGAFEVGVYLVLHLQADFKTGVWTGSAPRLMGTAPRGASLRDMQRALNRLEKIGFIRPFHRHGKRGNYRVLIHKYEPQSGALRGKRLNAVKSESWESAVYEPCAVVVAETDAESGAEAAPYLEVNVKTKKKRKTSAPAEPSPARQAQELAFHAFEAHYGQRPSWSSADYRHAVDLFKRVPGLGLDEFSRRWRNFLASTEDFTQKQAGSLKYFCTNFDRFMSGPVHGVPEQKGKSNGRDFSCADQAIGDVLEHSQRVA